MVHLATVLAVVSLTVVCSTALPPLWLNHRNYWYIRVAPLGFKPPTAAQSQQKAVSVGGGHYHVQTPAPPPPPAPTKPKPSPLPYQPQLQPAIRMQAGRGPPIRQPPPPSQPYRGQQGYPMPRMRQAAPSLLPPPVVPPPPPMQPVVDAWGRPIAWDRKPPAPNYAPAAGRGQPAAMPPMPPPGVPLAHPSPYYPHQNHMYHGPGAGRMGHPYMEPMDIDLRITACGPSLLEVTTAAPAGAPAAEPRCRCEDPQDCDRPGLVSDEACPLWTTCCCAPLPPTPPPPPTTAPAPIG